MGFNSGFKGLMLYLSIYRVLDTLDTANISHYSAK